MGVALWSVFYFFMDQKMEKKHKVTEHHGPHSFVVSYCYASCKPSPTMDNFKKSSRTVRGRRGLRRKRGDITSDHLRRRLSWRRPRVLNIGRFWLRTHSKCAEFL